MSKLVCRPYKEAKEWHLTQGFHSDHLANDFHYKYGCFLVSPEITRVKYIITDKNFNDSLEPIKRGYGIVLESLDGKRQYHHWHCLGVFPVNERDIVQRGQIVAQMGNSGFVISNGKFVLIKDRLKYPYPGTHTHYVMKIDKVTVNPRAWIDWNIPVNYTLLDKVKAAITIFLKMTKILKGRI